MSYRVSIRWLQTRGLSPLSIVRDTVNLLIFLSALTCGCKGGASESRRSEILMGTKVEVVVRGSGALDFGRAIDAAFGEMRKIERAMNRFDPDSELCLLNAAAGHGSMKISADMMNVLLAANRANKLSGGAFDPTVGPAMKLWSRMPTRFPTPDERATIRGIVGWNNVIIDTTNQSVSLAAAGVALDLDGIAKGYIADKGLDAIRRMGIPAALIDAGGDVAFYSSEGYPPWKVGISDPGKWGAKPILTLKLSNGALATSGNAWRYWDVGDKRYPRIIDPATLLPPENPPLSASAYSDNDTDADAWATASVVLGGKIATVEGKSAPALLIYTANGAFIVNDRWKELFGRPVSP